MDSINRYFVYFSQPYTSKDTDVPRQISRKIEICGFLNLTDIGSPWSISRHIVLPNENPAAHFAHSLAQAEKLENEIKSIFTKGDDDDATAAGASGAHADAIKESVCVLLHGALKFENTAALVLLGDEWYGFIYSHADSKRKSNLMLTILPPGENVACLLLMPKIAQLTVSFHSKDMMSSRGWVISDILEPSKIRCQVKISNFRSSQRSAATHKIVSFGLNKPDYNRTFRKF